MFEPLVNGFATVQSWQNGSQPAFANLVCLVLVGTHLFSVWLHSANEVAVASGGVALEGSFLHYAAVWAPKCFPSGEIALALVGRAPPQMIPDYGEALHRAATSPLCSTFRAAGEFGGTAPEAYLPLIGRCLWVLVLGYTVELRVGAARFALRLAILHVATLTLLTYLHIAEALAAERFSTASFATPGGLQVAVPAWLGLSGGAIALPAPAAAGWGLVQKAAGALLWADGHQCIRSADIALLAMSTSILSSMAPRAHVRVKGQKDLVQVALAPWGGLCATAFFLTQGGWLGPGARETLLGALIGAPFAAEYRWARAGARGVVSALRDFLLVGVIGKVGALLLLWGATTLPLSAQPGHNASWADAILARLVSHPSPTLVETPLPALGVIALHLSLLAVVTVPFLATGVSKDDPFSMAARTVVRASLGMVLLAIITAASIPGFPGPGAGTIAVVGGAFAVLQAH